MNVDIFFQPPVAIRTSLFRLSVGRAETIGAFGIGVTSFTVSGLQEDGTDSIAHVRGLTAGLSAMKVLKVEASASFQWEVSNNDNLNVLFGRQGINDFDRMVNKRVSFTTDNPPDPANMRGIFVWYVQESDAALQALFKSLANGSELKLDDLIAGSQSWAVIEMKGSGLPAVTGFNGIAAVV